MQRYYKKPDYICDNLLGGTVFYEDEVTFESDQPFLDYWLECAVCEMTDMQKLKLLCAAAKIKKNPYFFASAFVSLYFKCKDDEKIVAQIKKAPKVTELIEYVEQNEIDFEDLDELEEAVDNVVKNKN